MGLFTSSVTIDEAFFFYLALGTRNISFFLPSIFFSPPSEKMKIGPQLVSFVDFMFVCLLVFSFCLPGPLSNFLFSLLLLLLVWCVVRSVKNLLKQSYLRIMRWIV